MKANLVAAVTISAALLVTAVGCGDKSSAPESSSSSASSSATATSSVEASTSAAAAPSADDDHSGLLIDAADIVAPGDTFTAQEPTLNPSGMAGVATVFINGGDTREIGDTILLLPDAAAAATALQGASGSLGDNVTGGAPETVEVGSDAVMVSGTSPDGAKAVTVLLFTEGNAFTTLQFDSLPEDPVPAEFVLDVAGKQDEKIKAGLGG